MSRPSSRAHSRSSSAHSLAASAAGGPGPGAASMGPDGSGGRRASRAAEDAYVRQELAPGADAAFCNAFWGTNDAGYEVVQARMKTAARTLEDLRALYKERAEIESDYAKRLSKLSRQALGKDESGAMAAALGVVRREVEGTANTHLELANLIRRDLEGALAEFAGNWSGARRNSSVAIEKLYKQKQTQEAYVGKSREKYEQDCIKINGYTAQSSLVQGRDLDKVTAKLDKAQATVSGNDKDYQNFVRALKDTTYKWNGEWKSYLDQCQDLEEERLDFIKGNLWNFANAVSAVCVADDEGCERVRVSLENCESATDVLDFIHRRGTGGAIPDPPEYINYAKGQPAPARPSFHSANFQRNSTRPPPPVRQPAAAVPPPAAAQQQDPMRDVTAGMAGMGVDQRQESRSRKSSSGGSQSGAHAPRPPSAGPGAGDYAQYAQQQQAPPPQQQAPAPQQPAPQAAPQQQPQPQQQQQQQQQPSAYRPPPGAVSLPGMSAPPTSQSARLPPNESSGDSNSAPLAASASAPVAPQATEPASDPIADALRKLRETRPGGRSPGPPGPPAKGPGAQQFNNVSRGGTPSQQQGQYGALGHPRAPSPSPSQSGGVGRARSPSAAFMTGPDRSTSPLPASVDEVIGGYGQSFPGERRSVNLSRQNSAAPQHQQQAPPAQQQQPGAGIERSRSPGPSQQGFAGVGARGRSPSPAPFGRQQPGQQQPQQQPQHHHQQQQQARPTSMAPPARSTTPLGIQLNASGSVTHDQMAEEYIQRTGSVGPAAHRPQAQYAPQTHAPQAHHAPQASHASHAPPQRGHSPAPQHMPQRGHSPAPPQQHPHAHQQQQPPRGHSPAPPNAYGHATHQSQPSLATSQYGSVGYHGQAPQHYAQPPQQQQAAPQGYAPQGYGQQQYGAPAASTSPAPGAHGAYAHPAYAQQQASLAQQYAPAPQQAPQHTESPAAAYARSYHGQQQSAASYAPAAAPTPAPAPAAPAAPTQAAPTGQYSDSGRPILFYVSALYNYAASSAEEFSFTAGDVIAVTETNADGWWRGELLDEARRGSGDVFPSNFVSLLS